MAVHPTDKEFIYGYEAGLRNAGVPVAISAGDIAYSDLQTYTDDTVGSSLQETREDVSDLKSAIGDITTEVLAAYPTDTASGAVASFPDGAAVPVKDLTIAINPAQSGSGDPAPDNVRPISGWTEVKIWREVTHDTSANPTLTIDLDGTIYGGTLDVTTGVLTVDREFSVNDGSASGSYGFGSYPYVTLPLGEGKYKTGNPTSTITNIGVPSSITNGYILRFADGISGVTDKTTFGALLAQTPMQIVAPLATPATYQLTPTEVSTLLGANNIWADTGDVSVNYRADTTLYIDKLTGPTEDDMIADTNIASGQYFMVGNRLFLSTASIAAGATLTPGTNCTETNLAAALNALNS